MQKEQKDYMYDHERLAQQGGSFTSESVDEILKYNHLNKSS